ncbi:probable cytochrome P450 6a20 [Anopheles ziemanni]|uniref:probable cytochrome P450 6a20 n=1 Tax=Anopheles coustani TaxID=139045 RepID=UPI0026585938|nr:probable cytochrome P450 6a20 [Anopheles coustani]XP_058166255.1 probable cytochrome P450 6a20 [Anopheles ziemanni]
MYLPLLILALLLAVLWVRRRFSYWKDLGVPYVQPTFPHGNLREIGKTQHMSHLTRSVYHELKGKTKGLGFAGLYFFINPVTMVIDLELVKNVLVKDFSYFHDRAVYHNGKDDPLSEHLFAMEGTKWRNLRSKLTPTFTSGKMKMMFPTILAVADEFRSCLASTIHDRAGEVEMKELLARFTTDVIGNCAFGLECNSLKDPQAEFRRMGKKVFQHSRLSIIKRFASSQFRDLSRRLGVTNTAKDVATFFLSAVKDTVQFRMKNNVQRNDFMSLLMELMKEGKGTDKLSMEEASAQAFVFFLAGFETSSTAMSFCLYELALAQDLQQKARDCVRAALARHGAMTYEALLEMKYIEMCINESLRKYSPAAILLRIATQNYPVPGTKHTIPKGQTVIIPVHAIHHDPAYYPNPDRYDPERFSEEAKAKRNPYAFLPFGEGPRNCIGLRFGMMQARIGMAMLLHNFRFTLSPSMSYPVKVSTTSTVFSIEGGLFLKMEKI